MDKKLFNNSGFSLVEILIVILILSVMTTAGYIVLLTGQTTWFNADASIQLQENLRKSLEMVTRELQESGFDKDANYQVAVQNNAGINGSDIITFSIPIVCQNGTSVIDANGDVANWGAPLTWGCTDSTCMDADDDCLTRDYQSVVYLLANNNLLVRQILDDTANIVRQDTFGQNITDFQVVVSGDQNVITLSVTAQTTSVTNRVVNALSSVDVYLRNRG